MLREMKTKEGRKPVAKFLKVIRKLGLVSEDTAYLAALSVIFSELQIKKKT